MEDFGSMFGSLSSYIRAELIILIPVLYFIINFLKNSGLKYDRVQLYTNCISIILCGIYVFSTLESFTVQCILLGVYSSMTQGILLAGCAQFGTSLIGSHAANTDDTAKAGDTAHAPGKALADTAPDGETDVEREQEKE